MFYSPRGHIGFVHYPKTAGTSLQHWFRRVFPDGDLLDPENPHLTVASSLAAATHARTMFRVWGTCSAQAQSRCSGTVGRYLPRAHGQSRSASLAEHVPTPPEQ